MRSRSPTRRALSNLADLRWRTRYRPRTGMALGNSGELQRPVRQHRVYRCRPGPAPYHQDIPRKVAEHEAYRNAKRNNDPANARVGHDRALARAMLALAADDTELFKQFSDNEGFKRWLSDAVFRATYDESA